MVAKELNNEVLQQTFWVGKEMVMAKVIDTETVCVNITWTDSQPSLSKTQNHMASLVVLSKVYSRLIFPYLILFQHWQNKGGIHYFGHSYSITNLHQKTWRDTSNKGPCKDALPIGVQNNISAKKKEATKKIDMRQEFALENR